MVFSAIAANRGNKIGTEGGVLLCEVAQQVELLQTMPVCLELPAAPSPGALFVPTAVICPKVLQDTALCLRGQLIFHTGPAAWLIPGQAVGCGPLTAEAVSCPGTAEIAVLWVLKGTFSVDGRDGPIAVAAQTAPLMRTCASAAPLLGTWHVRVSAACLACTVLEEPGAALHGRVPDQPTALPARSWVRLRHP